MSAFSPNIGLAMEKLEHLLNQEDSDFVIDAIRKFKQNKNIDNAMISQFELLNS